MKIYDSTGFDAKLTGSFSGSFIGEVVGTSSIASTASYIELANVDGSASLAQSISSNSSSIASLEAVSGSYANSASFATDIFNNSASIASLESNSGSYLLNTTDTFTGDLTVTGEVIAQTLNVQQVTSSIVYSSGSNIFGDDASDVHQFTGSIRMGADSDLTVGRTLYANQIDSGTGILNINSESGFNAINLGSTYTYTDKLRVSQIQSAVGTGSIEIINDGDVALELPSIGGTKDIQFPYYNATNAKTIIRATGTSDYRQRLDVLMNTAQSDSSPTTILRIDNSGNIGIGTDNPLTNLLSIRGYGAIDSNANQGLTLSSNHYYDSVDKYLGNGYGSIISQDTGGTYAGYIRFQQAGLNSSGAGATMTLTDSMVIDESGNVGIGTNNPGAKLDIHAATNSNGILIREDTDDSITHNFYIDGSDNGVATLYANGQSPQIVLNTAGHSYFTGGYVGIGITSPACKLHVKSSDTAPGLIVEGDSGNEQIVIKRYSNSNEQLIFGFHSSDYARIQAVEQGVGYRPLALNQDGGNVGIGTTSPGAKLELRDDTTTLLISDTGNNYNDGDVQAVVHLSGRWYSGESNPSADLYSDARMVLRKNYSDGTGGSSLAFETSGNGATGLVEAIRITKDQAVGINTNTPSGKLHVVGDYYLQNGNMSMTQNYGITWNNGDNYIKGIGGYHLQFTTYDGSSSQNEVLRLTGGAAGSGGARAGIGQTTPAAKLDVNGDVAIAKNIGWYNATSVLNAGVLYWNKLGTWNTSQGGYNLHLEVHGGVGYNANDGQQSVAHIYFRTSNGSSTNNGMYADGYYYIEGASNIFTQVVAKEISSSEYEFYMYTNTFVGNPHVEAHCARGTSWDNDGSQNTGAPTGTTSSLSEYYYIHSPTTIASDINIAGSLTKGSGTFKIDHPLEEKSETHYLVHSFVESPKTDLLYRGKSTLVSGSISIDIDDYVGMTPGTFDALVDDTQVFTTNESNWDLVKGSISSSILTIESQNTNSTAEVSWLVIGDRKDPHIIETSWTDENGKPILEPLKS